MPSICPSSFWSWTDGSKHHVDVIAKYPFAKVARKSIACFQVTDYRHNSYKFTKVLFLFTLHVSTRLLWKRFGNVYDRFSNFASTPVSSVTDSFSGGLSLNLSTCSTDLSNVCPSYSFRKPNALTITLLAAQPKEALLPNSQGLCSLPLPMQQPSASWILTGSLALLIRGFSLKRTYSPLFHNPPPSGVWYVE